MKLRRIEPVVNGTFLHRYDLYYTLQNGGEKRYEMVSRRPVKSAAALCESPAEGVVMIVQNKTGSCVLLCREFRPAVAKTIYNFPAGLVEAGETPRQAARRELLEETGLADVRVERTLGRAYGAVGLSNESSLVCLCRADDSAPLRPRPNPDEELEPVWVGRAEAEEIIQGGAVTARVQLFLALWAGMAK